VDDFGGKGEMKTISAEEARRNITNAYQRLHNQGVDALSAAIDRVRNNKTAEVKAETASDRKPSLAELILAESAD
jgi:Na+-translocating ferredoxin:NAD+ oxidoreductase RnfC subunit